jgi:hypothetical protein
MQHVSPPGPQRGELWHLTSSLPKIRWHCRSLSQAISQVAPPPVVGVHVRPLQHGLVAEHSEPTNGQSVSWQVPTTQF